jgi:hypothetical protein
MRRLMFVLLLAGVAAPAVAADREGNNRSVYRERRAERDQSSDSDAPRREAPPARRQSSSEPRDNPGREDGSGRAAVAGPAVEQPRAARPERRAAGDTARNWRQSSDTSFEQRARKVEGRRPTLPDRPVGEHVNRAGGSDTVRNWRGSDRDGDQPNSGRTIEERNLRTAPNVREGRLVQPRGSTPRVFDPGERRVSPTPVWGTEPPAPRTAGNSRANPAHRWRGDWRNDRRYDWRDYRRRHHNRFRFAFYYDPFGWDYFRYGVGWRMWPSYYRSSYWLNDPWQYRLPPTYGPYRWIRYHNDALLVNIYTGEVVDVEYNFFW